MAFFSVISKLGLFHGIPKLSQVLLMFNIFFLIYWWSDSSTLYFFLDSVLNMINSVGKSSSEVLS